MNRTTPPDRARQKKPVVKRPHVLLKTAPAIEIADTGFHRPRNALEDGIGALVGASAMSLNFVTFNQDNSCLAVGCSTGFRIYHTEPFSPIFKGTDGNVSIIEMLFSTSLVALVLSPRHLIIKNTKASRPG